MALTHSKKPIKKKTFKVFYSILFFRCVSMILSLTATICENKQKITCRVRNIIDIYHFSREKRNIQQVRGALSHLPFVHVIVSSPSES